MAREGLNVTLEPIKGLTPKKLLNRRGFRFQCPPLDEFTVEYNHSHTDYDTLSAGQFSREGGRQLRTVTFDTLFVDAGLFTLEDEYGRIENLTRSLVRLLNSGKPFLLTAEHKNHFGMRRQDERELGIEVRERDFKPELQMAATLRGLRVAERAGEGDARYINVSFTEYRDPVVDRTGEGKQRRGGQDWPQKALLVSLGYAISERDRRIGGRMNMTEGGVTTEWVVTLHDLAKHYYGDPSQWKLIAKANDIKGWGAGDPLLEYKGFKHLRKDPARFTIARKSVTLKVPKPVEMMARFEAEPNQGPY